MNYKRLIADAIYVFLGAILLCLGIAEVVDSFWSGMGSALIAVGVMHALRHFRLHNDEAYREKTKVETTDERLQFLRHKAWGWAGYLFVLISAVCAIAFKLLGQDLLSVAAGFAVCIILVLYWFSYLFLRKKY